VLNIGFPCRRYFHEKNQSKSIQKNKTERFKDNHEYNQPKKYGRYSQYGHQITVEEKVWNTKYSIIFIYFLARKT
jgi:hypothetical protein